MTISYLFAEIRVFSSKHRQKICYPFHSRFTFPIYSELESDVEPWIIRARHRRRLSKRQRRLKSESRYNRVFIFFDLIYFKGHDTLQQLRR